MVRKDPASSRQTVVEPVDEDATQLDQPQSSTTRPTLTSMSLSLPTYKVAVFEKLVQMITELELPPGVRLVESDLASAFHVSKTPVREALLLLQADGLVNLRPYQGAFVTWLTIEEYAELMFLLDALEKPALPLVAERIKTSELQSIGRLIAELRRLRKAGDSHEFVRCNVQIHEQLFGVARSARLTRFVSALVARPGRRYSKVFQHQFDDAWDTELEVIIGRYDGVATGDPEAAIRITTAGHARLLDLARQRVDHPLVRPYLDPRSSTTPVTEEADTTASPEELINASRTHPKH